MLKRSLLLWSIAIVIAVVCVRLGLWQLERHRTRQAYNALVAERLATAPTGLAGLPADSAVRHYRRVQLSGTFEPSGEWVLANRSRDGSPGVHFLTPFRTDEGQLVVVNRGWVYAPDGRTVDRARWRETGRAIVSGYAEEFVGPGGPEDLPDERVLRRVRRAPFASAEPDVADFYVAATNVVPAVAPSEAAARDSIPVRLGEPALSEGSHLSYAFQWFGFATVAIVGAFFVDREQRRVTRRRKAERETAEREAAERDAAARLDTGASPLQPPPAS